MKKYNYITKKYLYKKYIKNKTPATQIAKKLKCSLTVIYYKLKKYNLPIRTIKEATKSINKRKDNANYIDGRSLKKYYCKDCEKEISNYQHKRCKKCFYISISGKNHYAYGTKGLIRGIHRFGKDAPNFGKKHPGINKGKNNGMFGKVTHSKGSYYKGIYMRSSYEIKFAQFLDLSGHKFLYESKTFNLGNTTYTPDFYIPEWDLYIEIKGYWYKGSKKRFKLFKRKYPKVKIKVLMQKDLQKIGINI